MAREEARERVRARECAACGGAERAERVLGVAELAVGPVGAETGEVSRARLPNPVPRAAAIAVLAEAARKPRAIARLLVGLHVEEDALLVAALAKLLKVPALRHPLVVEPVEEIAHVAALAQPAQPVLAHHLPAVDVGPRVGRRRHLLDAEHVVEVDVVHLGEDVHGFVGL